MSPCTRTFKRTWTFIKLLSLIIYDTLLVLFLKLSGLGILQNSIVNFYHNGEIFSFIVATQRKPKTIISITDENFYDVFNNVKRFLGPNEDFFCQKITPNNLGYKSLTITTVDFSFTFREHDIIKF